MLKLSQYSVSPSKTFLWNEFLATFDQMVKYGLRSQMFKFHKYLLSFLLAFRQLLTRVTPLHMCNLCKTALLLEWKETCNYFEHFCRLCYENNWKEKLSLKSFLAANNETLPIEKLPIQYMNNMKDNDATPTLKVLAFRCKSSVTSVHTAGTASNSNTKICPKNPQKHTWWI